MYISDYHTTPSYPYHYILNLCGVHDNNTLKGSNPPCEFMNDVMMIF